MIFRHLKNTNTLETPHFSPYLSFLIILIIYHICYFSLIFFFSDFKCLLGVRIFRNNFARAFYHVTKQVVLCLLLWQVVNLLLCSFLKNIYREKVNIPPLKSFITIQGAGADKTIVQWGDTAQTPGGPKGQALGTYGSATFAVNSQYFIAKNITFKVSNKPNCSVSILILTLSVFSQAKNCGYRTLPQFQHQEQLENKQWHWEFQQTMQVS